MSLTLVNKKEFIKYLKTESYYLHEDEDIRDLIFNKINKYLNIQYKLKWINCGNELPAYDCCVLIKYDKKVLDDGMTYICFAVLDKEEGWYETFSEKILRNYDNITVTHWMPTSFLRGIK